MLMRVLLINFLRWYRQLPIFRWHNDQINLQVRAHEINIRKLIAVENELEILKARMAEWVARSEGSRYKQLYDELKNKPHHLEQHANQQAKMLNWIRAHMRDMYPSLVDKAREKTRATD